MKVYDRRAFLKGSAMLTAAAAAVHCLPRHASGQNASPLDGCTGGLENFSDKQCPVLKDGRGASHPFFAARKRSVEVIAHRGGKGERPEETIEAFEHATKIGADILELDVRSTSDGELVLMHDKSVERTTNGDLVIKGKLNVNGLSYAKLKELDAGYWWTEDSLLVPKHRRNYPYRDRGVRIPKLRDVFEAFKDMRMNIEIKQSSPSLAGPLRDLIRDCKMTDKVLVASMSNDALKEFRCLCPRVATSASKSEVRKFIFNSKNLRPEPSESFRPDAVQMMDDALQLGKISIFQVLDKRHVAQAKRLNLPLHAWTVNNTKDMEGLIKLCVGGIITDYPSALIEALGRTPTLEECKTP